jgi:phosphatidate cytidylyltransferase
LKRIASALVAAPLFILLVWYGSYNLFALAVALTAAVSFNEFAQMAAKRGIGLFRTHGLISAVILPLSFIGGTETVYAAAALIMVSLFAAAVAGGEPEMDRLVYTLTGVFYVGLMYASFILIRGLPDGNRIVLLVCCSVWGADIGAYYTGRAFGKRKLAPAISPGKTVEGFFGGILLGFAGAALFWVYLLPEADGVMIVAAGLIGSVIGPVGDLSESLIKRYFGVKDSGNIMPGHGGALDRLDALMFAMPVYYVFLILKGYGS